MYKYSIKQFLGWKLLLIMAIFSVTFQIVLMIFDWYYKGITINISWNTVFAFSINYVNLIFVSGVIFLVVRWLNKKIKWSSASAILRTAVDFILFSIITIGWIVLVNQVILSFRSGSLLGTDQLIYFVAVGTVINLFLIPIIELMVLMNLQYRSALNTKQLLHENTKFRYEILKNQINPHFLFNSLSVLNPLISASPEKAKKYVNSFSTVLRHVLDFKDSNSIELREERKFLENYIFLLNTRFDKSFNANLNLPSQYMDKRILPMALQLLVENVVKHNKMSDETPVVVNIHAWEKGIDVWNRVSLRSSVSSWGIGLENIKMRYESLGYKILVEDTDGVFKIRIPYIEKDESINH